MKGLLFDNDGTLVDTQGIILASMRHSTREVLGRVIPDDVLMRKVGQPLAVQMRDFTPDVAEQEELLRVYRAHNETVHDSAVSAFPGAVEALATLRERGWKMGVVTSKMHRLAWRGLEITGLAPYLSCCIGADDCERFKPHPEPVERGAQALGLVTEDCLYVGDSPYDLQAGRAAGCPTVAVTWGVFPLEELQLERPDYMCATFDELVDVLQPLLSVEGR